MAASQKKPAGKKSRTPKKTSRAEWRAWAKRKALNRQETALRHCSARTRRRIIRCYERAIEHYLRESPDESQAGAPRTAVAKRAAVAALEDLRSTGSVLGRRFSGDIAANQRADLVGRRLAPTDRSRAPIGRGPVAVPFNRRRHTIE